MHALFNITSYYFLLLSILFSQFTTHLNAHNKNHHSIVLGLTHSSKTILPSPNPTFKSVKKTSEMLDDMSEPLKEIRDGYSISLNLGTPPQIIQVYMDTGSDLTWVPCGDYFFNCIDCDNNDNKNNMLMSSFSPSYSSSSYRDSCASHFCVDIHSSENSYDTCTIVGCSLTSLLKSTCYRPCPSFAYTYGEGVVSGSLTRDTLRVHLTTPYGYIKEIPKFCFGCVGNTYKEPIGIAGFGRGSLSFPSQLGFSKKGFSHCFLPFKFANNPNITSPLVIGSLAISSKDYLHYTPMLNNVINPNGYYIGLEAIYINNITSSSSNHQMPLSLKEIDSSGNGGLLIDSGTTYTHLPNPLYTWVLSTLEEMINHPRDKEVEIRTGFDLCYKVPCPNTNDLLADDENVFPSVTLRFLNNVSLLLPEGNVFYAMNAPSNLTVVKCLLFQEMDDNEDGAAGVFGSFQQQNVEVVYDLEKERIGFQSTDCASAVTSQGLHKIGV